MTSRKIDHTTRLIPSLPSMPKGISCYLILTSIHPKVPDSSHSDPIESPRCLGQRFLTILRNLRNLAPKDEKYTLHNMSSALGNDTRCGRCAKPYIIEFCGRGLGLPIEPVLLCSLHLGLPCFFLRRARETRIQHCDNEWNYESSLLPCGE